MNLTKLISDYESLDRNDFYKILITKFTEYSKGRASALREAPLDKVARLQGELSAIDWVLSRPKDVISEITKEDNTNNA